MLCKVSLGDKSLQLQFLFSSHGLQILQHLQCVVSPACKCWPPGLTCEVCPARERNFSLATTKPTGWLGWVVSYHHISTKMKLITALRWNWIAQPGPASGVKRDGTHVWHVRHQARLSILITSKEHVPGLLSCNEIRFQMIDTSTLTCRTNETQANIIIWTTSTPQSRLPRYQETNGNIALFNNLQLTLVNSRVI